MGVKGNTHNLENQGTEANFEERIRAANSGRAAGRAAAAAGKNSQWRGLRCPARARQRPAPARARVQRVLRQRPARARPARPAPAPRARARPSAYSASAPRPEPCARAPRGVLGPVASSLRLGACSWGPAACGWPPMGAKHQLPPGHHYRVPAAVGQPAGMWGSGRRRLTNVEPSE